jgi:spectinomycin phosphotransferase
MLEPPDLKETDLQAAFERIYGLPVQSIQFLPLGADLNTAIYRVGSAGADYFLKLRQGGFDGLPVEVPAFLRSQGVPALIPVVPTRAGQLWERHGGFAFSLYPYIAGQDAYTAALSDANWREFGAALKAVHAARLPEDLLRRIPREQYPARWPDELQALLGRARSGVFAEPAAVRAASLFAARRAEIDFVLERTRQLARRLRQAGNFVLCHTDLHPGNLHITPQGQLYLVDWDNPLLALPERDLMYVGAASDPAEAARTAALFYQGYGAAQVDEQAAAYYRYIRIVEDLAIFCDQLLFSGSSRGAADREQAYLYLESNFIPGGAIAVARRADSA